MSECVSRQGEYSEHTLPGDPDLSVDERFTCTVCGTFASTALAEEFEQMEGDLAIAVAEARRLRAFAESLLTLETDIKARAGAGLGTIIDQARAALAGSLPPQEEPNDG
jgi:hypothetical protein